MSDPRPVTFERTLTDPDGVQVKVGGRTQAAVEAKVAALQAEWTTRAVKAQLVAKIHALTDLARDQNWDWIDVDCDPTVALYPMVREQSPNAGAVWGTRTTFDKAERLRFGVSLLMVDMIRVTQAIDLLLDVVADGFTRDPRLTAPPDR